jgi:hypothetical protein
MAQRITVERVKDFIISKSGNEYDLTTLNNIVKALNSLYNKRMDELDEEGFEQEEFIIDEECQVILAYSNFIREEIRKEKFLKSALTGPKTPARITSSINLTGQRNEGGRRTRRTKKSKKRSRKMKIRY